MIETVPFDIALSFLIGMLIPLAAPERAREARNFLQDETFAVAVLFELFFFLPVGAYLFFFHPDWSMMYFLDLGALAEKSRILIGAAALAGYFMAAVVGAALAGRLVRQNQERTAYLIMAAVGLVLAGFSAFTLRQLTQIGTFAEWNALPRTTTQILFHRVGSIVGVDAVAAGAALGIMLRSLKKQ